METTILLTIKSQADLDALYNFLKTTSIEQKVQTYTETSVVDDPEFNKYIYSPSSDFKSFCGAENMNKFGYVSLQSAYNLIIVYAKNNGLYDYPYIDIDSVLKEALSVNDHSISVSDLAPLLKKLFKKII
jgi:hypothetical protein